MRAAGRVGCRTYALLRRPGRGGGLHRWWDGLVAVYAGGVRLEAWVRLWPDDIEALIRPNYLMRDFRARFRLYVDGEWSNWRLEEVCDYHLLTLDAVAFYVR